jgi:glycosyltransferase involved in cell wall biosynthesis
MKLKTDTLIILIPGFPANEADSSCLPAQQALVRSLNALFPALQVKLIAFQYPFRDDVYRWHGNEVLPLNGQNRGRIHRLLTWLRAWRTFRKIKRKQTVTGILSCWLGECALVGQLLAKRYRLPHLTWLLGQDALPGNRFARLLHPRAVTLAAISDQLAENYFRTYGVRPAHVIPNGIDPSVFGEMLMPRDIDILGAGSLISLKQYDIFIDIVVAIKKQRPQLRVVLCGDGPQKEELQGMIRQYQLHDTVLLTGELKHEEILRHMQRSRVFLHPSSYEGFSGACLEALYAGAEVVSFLQPMHAWIRKWHVVPDVASAVITIEQLLLQVPADHGPVLPFHMHDSARGLMEVFGYQPANSLHR